MALPDISALRRTFRGALVAAVPSFAALLVPTRFFLESDAREPPAAGLWVRESLAIAAEIKVATGTIETSGRIVYDVVSQPGPGVSEAESMVGLLAGAISPGGSPGGGIIVDRAERLSGAAWDTAWFAHGVAFVWRVYTKTEN